MKEIIQFAVILAAC